MSGGQFDWGGRLLKGNGGVQRSTQVLQKRTFRVQWHKSAWLQVVHHEQVRKQVLVILSLFMGTAELNG